LARISQGLAALRNFGPAKRRYGSWLCENSSARSTRRNIFDQLHL
jgi:endonuclease YncB( thermonuclease family)